MIALLIILMVLSSCSYNKDIKVEPGVSYELAQYRKATIDSVIYDLEFLLPLDRNGNYRSSVNISFDLKKGDNPQDLQIDFRTSDESVYMVEVNGVLDREAAIVTNEHIVIPESLLKEGFNQVYIEFNAGTNPLNVNEEYLYTLLVPDRARELFPCFDQPDMKASYNLILVLDAQWEAVSNSPVVKTEVLDGGYKRVSFAATEPLSTYLFAFAAGNLSKSLHSDGEREITILHRETSEENLSQMGEIADQVFSALSWLEEYTAIEYPFAKYDLVIIPGFQFGGMEHTGATFYNASLMFLPQNYTLAQKLRRDLLIAHETAHMWFGDYVTMKWFSGVWIKEVFANYFAARMIRPHYTDIDFKLQDLSFNVSAYVEDRTAGANSIQQELPNLRYAGLIYGNIIYQKSPVVMEMLSRKMGDEAFQRAIREYLSDYAYGNADWDDLVDIFDKYYNADGESIKEWSEYWIYGKGMPVVKLENGKLIGEEESHQKVLTDTLEGYVIPAADGSFYGYLQLDGQTSEYILENLYKISDSLSVIRGVSSELVRESLLITLYENWLRGNLSSEKFLNALLGWLGEEKNQQVVPTILSDISAICHFEGYGSELSLAAQRRLFGYVIENENEKFATQVFRTLVPIATDKEICDYIYKVWSKEVSLPWLSLSENDFIDISLELGIRFPEKYDLIVSEQLCRISNPDKVREYKFVSPSAHPLASVRDSVFNSYYDRQNRMIEPWVLKSLLLLHHPHWGDYSVKYIYPSLELMPELQRTGDIFFPKSWCKNTLHHHYSVKAKESVLRYLENTPDLLPLLENKILQASFHLGIK
ncbi:MAG: aminopeptidase [Bacteroidales bacterium]|nr:aminopeptidase [Bacteroidales bacterium]